MTEKTKVKLNENYGNEFLTLNNGDVVYKKTSRWKSSEWHEVENTKEVKSLIKQKTLIEKQKEKFNKNEMKNEIKNEIKEEMIDEKIIKDNDNKKKNIKEIKTKNNDKEMEENKDNLANQADKK